MYIFTKSSIVNESLVFNAKKIHRKDEKVFEEWRRVKINDDLLDYEVSTLGEVRDLYTKEKLKISSKSSKKKRENSYLSVTLIVNPNGEKKKFSVHRLVAIAFLPIRKKYRDMGLCHNDLEVNHKDLHKWHNVVTNLEWVTKEENIKHAKDHGAFLSMTGDNSPNARISNLIAAEICERLSRGEGNQSIASELNITVDIVAKIKYKQSWKHISEDYYFPTQIRNTKIRKPVSDDVISGICYLLDLRKCEVSDKEIATLCRTKRKHVTNIRSAMQKLYQNV